MSEPGARGPGRADGQDLTGSLLVATPLTGDVFERAVVLVLHHDADGAHGLILNRPMDARVEAVLPQWQPFVTAPGVLFRGGPVGPDTAMGLVSVPGHDPHDPPLGTQLLFGGIGLVDLDAPAPLVVPELGAFRIFVGYSGWAAGQVESELRRGAWYVVPREPRDPFHEDVAGLWREVLLRQRSSMAFVTTWTDVPETN
ncbi:MULTISPECIES: YqgE/AlgH family protein [Ornithinimicrobium]|uniref:YqgE/AlgH family protein n=1 Tax=Ornithinimicrobium kibberense TaxID=282060 RepID=A0ABV5UZ94_9MICO|nr:MULTISPECIES: YqgE/AlgH family protein [Ornithinimicrobium]